MSRKSLIIIKHGFSETCDHNVSGVVSYGDVFRCTCLLEDFKGWHVTWITAHKAKDLLVENHLIDSLILADSPAEIPFGRLNGRYDMIINLEKQKDWCEFSRSIRAGQKFGFRNWVHSGTDIFYPGSAKALTTALRRDGFAPLQETLYKTIGREWTGQRYVLGYQPKVAKIYDIGLNNHVGPKWPTKIWDNKNWQQLYKRLSQNYAVCWQQSLNSIRNYIDWLACCRLVITCDSLGLHLSLALKNKVVALFGSTPAEQIYMYGLGTKLTPVTPENCVPCFLPRCELGHKCIDTISVDMVVEAVDMLMNQSSPTISNILVPQENDMVTANSD